MGFRLKYLLSLIPKLGYFNTAYGIYYKCSQKFKFRKFRFKIQTIEMGSFYRSTKINLNILPTELKQKVLNTADNIIENKFTYFFKHQFDLTDKNIWYYDPFKKLEYTDQDAHWMELQDFGAHDIKVIWENSRFYWLISLSKAYRISLNEKYLNKINSLLSDWTKQNPINAGPNWKCGQEAAIRVMNILFSAFILDQFLDANKTILSLVFHHLERIEKNITYAIIQDNNHGTSEAAALYIGGAWLEKNTYRAEIAFNWKKKGRKILSERINKLVQNEGSFSQKSANYHRVFLDTMTFVLFMMECMNLSSFDKKLTRKLETAGEWQAKIIFGNEGQTPNFGSNDGAMLNILHSCDYTDFRPSTQTFFAVLKKKILYEKNPEILEPVLWLYGEETKELKTYQIKRKEIEVLDDQILIMTKEKTKLFLKIPEDSFRPGNDAFHIDFWVDGQAVFVDSGTYSYNHKSADSYKSVKAHNTAQFGNHEQMPKLSKFLNAEWIKADSYQISKNENKLIFKGQYSDYCNNIHIREVILDSEYLQINDSFETEEEVTIRYHLNLGAMDNFELKNASSLFRKSTVSKYYLDQEEVEVLELQQIDQSNKISLKINYRESFITTPVFS